MAVGDLHVLPGFLTPVLTQLSFQSNQLLFSHASAEVRGENTPERKFTSTGYQTHNHQVISLTTESSGRDNDYFNPLPHDDDSYASEEKPDNNVFYCMKDKFNFVKNNNFLVGKCFQFGKG